MSKTKHYVQVALFVFLCEALLASAILFVPPSYHYGGGLVLLGTLLLMVEEMLFHRDNWIPIRSR